MNEMWTVVADERHALAGELAGLTDEQWQTPSLCEGWSVRDVLAHMTGAGSQNPATFLMGFAAAGFDFDKFANRRIAMHLGATPADTMAGFKAIEHSTSAPPGPKTTWLGEVVVHGEDIRRPLGIVHDYDLEVLKQVADFYKRSNTLIGSRSRIAGLRLVATDTDWSHGEGEEVSGPMISLVMAMTGRSAACDDLAGPGVGKLRGGVQ
jgi:uncharacterized protein (TIGR03083 family)